MKKLFFITAAATLLIGSSAYAAVGDIAGEIYTTDILTEVDGRSITSYCIDGETLIPIEDLEEYGFSVYYNDNIRTVFVTKTGEPDNSFRPYIPRGRVGETAGYYYESDITAVVNGQPVPAYAIDGKMVVKAETLGDGSLSKFYPPLNCYGMSYTYDNQNRLLSLNTKLSQFGSVTSGAEYALDYTLWSYRSCLIEHSSDILFVGKIFGGLPHGGTGYYYYICLPNGLVYNPYSIARRYYINMTAPVLSEDGKSLYFINNTNGTGDYKQLNIYNMHIQPLDADTYEHAAMHITDSDYTFTLNGVNIPMYSIGSQDYIKAEDMSSCGFVVSMDEKANTLNIMHRRSAALGKDIKRAGSVNGTARPSNISVTFNGDDSIMYNKICRYNYEYYIPISAFDLDDNSYLNRCGVKYNYYPAKKSVTASSAALDYSSAEIDDNGYRKITDYSSSPEKTFYGSDYKIEVYEDSYNSNGITVYPRQIYLLTNEGFSYNITSQIYKYIYGNDLDNIIEERNSYVTFDRNRDIVTITSSDKKTSYSYDIVNMKIN